MTNGLLIVGLSHEEDAGRRIGKLASFAGAEPGEIAWFSANSEGRRAVEMLTTGDNALIISSGAIRHLSPTLLELSASRSFANASCQRIVIFGFDEGTSENDLLRRLTQGRVAGRKKLGRPSATCTVNRRGRHIFGPLAGLDIPVEGCTSSYTFALGEGTDSSECLMTMADNCLLARVSTGTGEIFLIGTEEPPDIDDCVAEDTPLLSHFFTLVPWLACIRHLLGKRSWISGAPRACFIIDDPLLRKRYGCLNYQSLLDLMRRHTFCTSIAFIPWNYRRTKRDIADLFVHNDERFSLSVHGCDHTWAEFVHTDVQSLREAAVRALRRMAQHERMWGVPFDKIMVFPQGLFSTAAMSALKSAGYLAAVNTTPYPVDSLNNMLLMRDLLDVAIMRFSNHPLFVRRRPANLVDIAFDLFLGKPALLVEHHGYFRNGYDAMGEITDNLNALDSRLEWRNLATICSHACLTRLAGSGEVQVRFYADTFWLRNDLDCPRSYVLFRRRVPEEAIKCVTIDGRGADFGQEADWLRIPLVLNPLEAARIQVEHAERQPAPIAMAPGFTYNTKVLLRRLVAEFLDDYVDTHRLSHKALSTSRDFFRRKKRGRHSA